MAAYFYFHNDINTLQNLFGLLFLRWNVCCLFLILPLSSRLAPPVLGSGLGVTLPHFPHSSGLEQTRPDLAASDMARSEAEIKIPPDHLSVECTLACRRYMSGYLSPSVLRMTLRNLASVSLVEVRRPFVSDRVYPGAMVTQCQQR